jgi:hypothetical protein
MRSAPVKEKKRSKFFPLRACTTLRQQVVCTTSNCAYRQMYIQLIQPIDKEVIRKLFNILHGV